MGIGAWFVVVAVLTWKEPLLVIIISWRNHLKVAATCWHLITGWNMKHLLYLEYARLHNWSILCSCVSSDPIRLTIISWAMNFLCMGIGTYSQAVVLFSSTFGHVFQAPSSPFSPLLLVHGRVTIYFPNDIVPFLALSLLSFPPSSLPLSLPPPSLHSSPPFFPFPRTNGSLPCPAISAKMSHKFILKKQHKATGVSPITRNPRVRSCDLSVIMWPEWWSCDLSVIVMTCM